MATIYLYIPFSENEDPKELQDMAEGWKKIYMDKQNLKETLSEDSEQKYVPNNVVICTCGNNKIKDVKEGDNVYILAHGIDNTNITHSRSSNKYTLSQEDIVKRMNDDGLPKDTEFGLKLYYCDEKNNALERMQEFYNALETMGYKKINLYYYPNVLLTSPIVPKETMDPSKAYKRAYHKVNLLELEKNELQKYLKERVASMDAETLKNFLDSLGLNVIMKLIDKSDLSTLKLMQQKANISNINQFLSTLHQEEIVSITVLKELGHAKDFKQKFKPK